MFQLTAEEWENLRFHFETSSWGGRRYPPKAFTEQGIAMLSGVLTSDKAIAVNIAIMKTFVLIRQFALDFRDFADRLKQIEDQFADVYEAIRYLLEKDNLSIEQSARTTIGFKRD